MTDCQRLVGMKGADLISRLFAKQMVIQWRSKRCSTEFDGGRPKRIGKIRRNSLAERLLGDWQAEEIMANSQNADSEIAPWQRPRCLSSTDRCRLGGG
jgi:hypothetical protein